MNKIACPECHNLVLERASYCHYCGRQLRRPSTYLALAPKTPRNRANPESAKVLAHGSIDEVMREQQGTDGGRSQRHGTWQTVVETSSRPVPSHPPRPRRPAQSWRFLRNMPYGGPFRTALFFWFSVFLLLAAVCAGIFGIARSVGSTVAPAAFINTVPELRVSPNIAAIGAVVALHGDGFTPHGQVGLFRDNAIPLPDSHATTTLSANAQGVIDTTVHIDSYWGSGEHTIMAEDATTHKRSLFPLQVFGGTDPLRPAHLHLSPDQLDFGSGDQATNSLQTIELSDSGAGQVSWQASATQPWLMLSPDNGTLYAGQPVSVTVAIDRYNLLPGTYSASVYFSSDAGNSVLNVTMKVTALQTGNNAVLQLSPPVLSFSAVDSASSPDPQVVTVSNPGHAALSWATTTSAKWLRLSQTSGAIAPSQSNSVAIGVQSASLLPGTYRAQISFFSQGLALHSPQQVIVSVTILPPCSVQVGPGIVNFNGTVGQGAPAPQALTISSAANCTAPAHWSARSSANWVVLSASSGLSSNAPTVSVNPAGLAAGAHQAQILFTTATGIQTIVVNFVLSGTNTPNLDVGTSALTFQGSIGDGNPGAQTLTLTNTGVENLLWHVDASTTDGGNWLSASSVSGSLASLQKTALGISVAQLASFTPGRYSGMLSITATDSHHTPSSLKQISVPVSFVVNAACSLSVSQDVLTFAVLSGSATAATAPIHISASNACLHPLSWQAVPVTDDGGHWLSALPATGSLTATQAATTQVGIINNSLAAQTYHGSLRIMAVDTVTHRAVGGIQTVAVTLNVQPPCTLQVPSTTSLAFNAAPGQNPAAQTFSIGVVGNCNGAQVTLVPTPLLSGSTQWLNVLPTTVTLPSGKSSTMTVSVDTSHLTANHYVGSISVAALLNGLAIVGSPQTVNVTLDVASAPALSVTPVNGIHFDLNTGNASSQVVTVSNTGGGSMNWSAALTPDSPAFVSLAQAASSNLIGGNSATFTITADASTVAVGDYTATLVVNGIDASSGQPLGTPYSIPVTISVTAPVPLTPSPTPVVPSTPTNLTATATATPVSSATATTSASPALVVTPSPTGTVTTPQAASAATSRATSTAASTTTTTATRP